MPHPKLGAGAESPPDGRGLSQAMCLPLLAPNWSDFMWYDVNRTLSHNCLFNFVVGPRGTGKTYSCKRRAIRNFLRKGEQFIYLRRYETELQPSNMEKFFDDIMTEFPDEAFLAESQKFYINRKIAGYYLPLSKAAQYKSVPFPNVSLIIFDEFIIDTGMIRYLPNEVITFNEMYSTIARLRDVTVMFLANAITFTNPYFLFYDLKLQQDQKICKKNDILLELVEDDEYTQVASQTRFGRIIANTDYGKYALQNKFLRDNDDFVETINKPGIPIFNVRIGEITLGVYRFVGDNRWQVSEKYDKTVKRTISVDISSHNETTTLTKESATLIWWKELQQRYYRAEVVFSSVKAKNVLVPYLRKV